MPHGHPRQRARLDELLAGPVRWDELVTMAENENMGGLLWLHLRDIVDLPEDTRLRLMGLHMRRRALTQFQEEAIARILDVAAGIGVEVMLLKGAALRRLAYAGAELRPMRDIDVLASADDGRRLHDALAGAGFARVDPKAHPIHHPMLLWQQDGFGVGVDIHWVTHAKWPAAFDDLALRGTRIDVLGRPAWVPSRVDLLRHVFLHAFGSDLWLGSRMVAIADLVAMIETSSEALDERRLSRRDRALVRALGWLDLLTPLSDTARARVGSGECPGSRGVGEFYTGWPLESSASPLRSWPDFLATCAPSPWWLRLRYRSRRGLLPLALAWVRHVNDVFWVWR